jgi:hypothetical protein
VPHQNRYRARRPRPCFRRRYHPKSPDRNPIRLSISSGPPILSEQLDDDGPSDALQGLEDGSVGVVDPFGTTAPLGLDSRLNRVRFGLPYNNATYP